MLTRRFEPLSIVAIALTCLIMLGFQGWREWVAHSEQVRETEGFLVHEASSLTQHAEDTIEVADTAVADLVERLKTDGTSKPTLAQIDRKLAAQIAAGARYSAVIVLDANGNLLATSLPAKEGNFSDRDYFIHHREEHDLRLFVGPPIQNRFTGDWIMTVSRSFQAPDGSFAGVVVAIIRLSYFVNYYAAFGLGQDSSITLLATDGALLARYPSDDRFIGQNFISSTVFSRLRERSAGSYSSVSVIDGVRRLTAYRRSDRYSLVVVAAMSQDQAMAAWRADARIHMLMTVVLAGTAGLLALFLVRQLGRSRASEERMRENEALLRGANERVLLATESGAIGLWEWNVTEDTMIWNSWVYRLFGAQTPEQIPTYALWKQHLHPDDRAATEQVVRDGIAGMKRYLNDFRVVWDDGSIHHLRSAGQPTRDAVDGSIRVTGSTWDITSQRVEEEQRAIIVEAAPNGMIIVDEVGLITLANSQAERIFKYPRGTLIGQPVTILLPDGFRVAHSALRSAFTDARGDRALTTGRIFTGRKQDGSRVMIEVMLNPIKTPRGRITVASLLDITERQRKAAEQQETEKQERLALEAKNADDLDRLSRHLADARDRADRANRAKSRFLAGMSHELRTPLNGILGYAQLLHIEGGLNVTQKARVDAMLGAGKHLLEMITCVLDLSEIEAELVELQAVQFNVRSVAEACLDLIRPMADAKSLALSIVMAPDTQRELVSDPTRFRQVLLNLLGNAAKFTEAGGIELRLRSVIDGTMLRVEVVDTGAGIPADHRQRLFNDFERADTGADRGIEGSGLGLAIASRLAGLMGGRLGYDDNPGGGSVFWLEVPANIPIKSHFDLVSVSNEQGAQLASLATRALHVLVVDDVLMNRNIAEAFLQAAGHEVTCAEDGSDAVAAVARADFDVVLMDVRMPHMDGLEATRRIRAMEGPRGQVPIVALTAQAFTDQIAACRRAGMDSHLGKPFDMETLLAAVVRAVEPKRRPAVEPRLDVALVSTTAVPSILSIEQPLPVLDTGVFQRTTGFLAPEKVVDYMQTIAELGETVLGLLVEADVLAGSTVKVADAAHTLAGSAGMLGFARVAAASRSFERAVHSGATEAPTLASELRAAVEVTLEEIQAYPYPVPSP